MPADRGLHLEILTPDRRVFSGDVESVVIPAADGLLGILYGHAPLVAMLKPGTVTAVPSSPAPPVLSHPSLQTLSPSARAPAPSHSSPPPTPGTLSFPLLSGFCRVQANRVMVICRTAAAAS